MTPAGEVIVLPAINCREAGIRPPVRTDRRYGVFSPPEPNRSLLGEPLLNQGPALLGHGRGEHLPFHESARRSHLFGEASFAVPEVDYENSTNRKGQHPGDEEKRDAEQRAEQRFREREPKRSPVLGSARVHLREEYQHPSVSKGVTFGTAAERPEIKTFSVPKVSPDIEAKGWSSQCWGCSRHRPAVLPQTGQRFAPLAWSLPVVRIDLARLSLASFCHPFQSGSPFSGSSRSPVPGPTEHRELPFRLRGMQDGHLRRQFHDLPRQAVQALRYLFVLRLSCAQPLLEGAPRTRFCAGQEHRPGLAAPQTPSHPWPDEEGGPHLQQPAAGQRRLLRVVLRGATWKAGQSRMPLREPFQRLRRSNSASHTDNGHFGGDSGLFGMWLGGRDSNPDKQIQSLPSYR